MFCLVDLSLPDRDGLALVHRLALEQGATVIIISGRAQVAGPGDGAGARGPMTTS